MKKTKILWIALLISLVVVVARIIFTQSYSPIIGIIWLSATSLSMGFIMGAFTLLVVSRGKAKFPSFAYIYPCVILLSYCLSPIASAITGINLMKFDIMRSTGLFIVPGYLIAFIYGEIEAIHQKEIKSFIQLKQRLKIIK